MHTYHPLVSLLYRCKRFRETSLRSISFGNLRRALPHVVNRVNQVTKNRFYSIFRRFHLWAFAFHIYSEAPEECLDLSICWKLTVLGYSSVSIKKQESEHAGDQVCRSGRWVSAAVFFFSYL